MLTEFLLVVFSVFCLQLICSSTAVGSATRSVIFLGIHVALSLVFLSGSGGLIGLVFFISSLWVLIVLFCGAESRDNERASLLQFLSLAVMLVGWILVSTSSFFLIVFSFELMTLGALTMLRLTTKGERGEEALLEMYFWALMGSFFLLLSLSNFIINAQPAASSQLLTSIFALSGFAIKVPLWPFASWLLKAHVEASTEFSIFLSGFLVKFGVLGLYRLDTVCFANLLSPVVSLCSVMGLMDATWRMLAQVDLKRIIALLTIVETNWLTLCLFSNSTLVQSVGLSLIVVHVFTTTLEFTLVEILYRRFNSRSIVELIGVSQSCPTLGLLCWGVCLTSIGLPGSSIFVLKFLFLVGFSQLSLGLTVVISFLMLVIIPCFLVRVFSCIVSGQARRQSFDITSKECLFCLIAFGLSFVIGFIPLLFVC